MKDSVEMFRRNDGNKNDQPMSFWTTLIQRLSRRPHQDEGADIDIVSEDEFATRLTSAARLLVDYDLDVLWENSSMGGQVRLHLRLSDHLTMPEIKQKVEAVESALVSSGLTVFSQNLSGTGRDFLIFKTTKISQSLEDFLKALQERFDFHRANHNQSPKTLMRKPHR